MSSHERQQPLEHVVVLRRACRLGRGAVLGVQSEARTVVVRAAPRGVTVADARAEGDERVRDGAGVVGVAVSFGELLDFEAAAEEDAVHVHEGEARDENVMADARAAVYYGFNAFEVEEGGVFYGGVEGEGVGLGSAEDLEAPSDKLLRRVADLAEPLNKWIADRQNRMRRLKCNNRPDLGTRGKQSCNQTATVRWLQHQKQCFFA
jgi:hypothetical protein